MHLGVFENFVGFICNATIEYDIFKVRSASLAARTQMSVGRLKADLLAWCRRDRVANPDRPQYPLQNFIVREPPRARSAERKLRQERLFITRRIWRAASLTSCHRELSFFLLGEPWSGTFRSLGARQGTCLSANNKISWMRTRDTLFFWPYVHSRGSPSTISCCIWWLGIVIIERPLGSRRERTLKFNLCVTLPTRMY